MLKIGDHMELRAISPGIEKSTYSEGKLEELVAFTQVTSLLTLVFQNCLWADDSSNM